MVRRSLHLALLVCGGIACQSAPEPVRPVTDPPASEVDGGDAETANAAAAAAEPTRPEGVVYRSELDRATARGPAYLLRQLGPEPHRIDGRFVGYRITRLFPDEPGLCSDPCDLHEGDVIVAVNGVRIERPEHLATLFEQLPSMTELRVDRLREGEGQSRTYRILPDPAPTGAP